jgi:hypothetical protein
MRESDLELARLKLNNDHQLGRYGLQGTLYGAFAALLAIVIIAVVQALTDRYIVRDWAFASMTAVIIIPVIYYGTFVFKRTLKVGTDLTNEGSFSLRTETGGDDTRNRVPPAG